MRVKVIVDNISSEGVKGEWGLSFYIEYENKKILLDVGASDLFYKNALQFGIDINSIDYAVLSHSHYDHSGGMKCFFENNDHAFFYMRKALPCYYKMLFLHKYIGMPRGITNKYESRIKYVSGDYMLCDGVYLIPHQTKGLSLIAKREMMYQKTTCGWMTDDFSHEQSLVFDTDKGLIIFNSCSHGGAVNIINEVAALFPNKKVYGLIGGFHLFNKSRRKIKEVAEQIKATGIKYVCTGHCTKNRAYKILKKELGDILYQMHVGLEINF